MHSTKSIRFGQSSVEKSPTDQANWKSAKSQNRSLILINPYHLAPKTTVFREKYMEHIGYSVQATQPTSMRLGVNVEDIRKAIECLGFKKLREDMAEHLVPDDEKLSLLVMTSSDNPALCGISYLAMKSIVGMTTVPCTKWLLFQSLRQMDERIQDTNKSFLTGSGNPFGHEYFVPFTVCMDAENLESILETRPGTYLAKPVRDTEGQRQQLVRIRANRVQKDLLSFLRTSQFQTMERSQVLLQEYIERPLLVDKRKFIIRVYLLVANPKRAPDSDGRPRQSGYFAFLHPGYVRLCSEPYDPDNARTGQQVDTVGQFKEVTTWYPDELNLYLNKKQRVPQPDWVMDVLYPRVGAALGFLVAAFRCRLDDRDSATNTFRILSSDLLVDESLRLHLLELNELPSWIRQTSVLNDVKPNLWREAICLTSEIAIRYKTYRTISDDRLITRQNFRMVYSSEDPCLARRNVTLMYD